MSQAGGAGAANDASAKVPSTVAELEEALALARQAEIDAEPQRLVERMTEKVERAKRDLDAAKEALAEAKAAAKG